ncbi:MAG: hypothetical protein HW378_510 [Anaerolineales bacterium]|jgi:hypothetical protein|nr:hypothetical protein [Anaerolineales bacterium]MBM2847116.1 hypothetical protein [Anaerolineales bacterium]
MNGRTILIGLLVLALLAGAAGVGVYAYNAGVAQGLVQSGKVTVVEGGPYANYGGPFFFPRPFGFGFGFLGCLFPLLFFFLIFGLLRGLLWRGPWGWRRGWGGGGHHGHGPWGEGSVPPMFEEWHRRAHSQAPSESTEPPSSGS